jgi:hypothetical protein
MLRATIHFLASGLEFISSAIGAEALPSPPSLASTGPLCSEVGLNPPRLAVRTAGSTRGSPRPGR